MTGGQVRTLLSSDTRRTPEATPVSTSSLSRRARVALVLVILLAGIALRFHALTHAGRFHADEALFSTFARSAALNGHWLFPGPLDKPPLALYASALSMALLVDSEKPVNLPDLSPRMGEFAARLPGTLAGILMMPLAYALAASLYRSHGAVAIATLAFTAFSPLTVVYSASAFTDALMLPLTALSMLAAARLRCMLAGIALGLAFLAKQQALLALPLILGIGWAIDERLLLPRLAQLLTPVALAALALFVWDNARGQPDGVWALAAANNDPWRLLRSEEVWPRLGKWAEHAGWLLGPPMMTAGLLALALFTIVRRWHAATRGGLLDRLALTYVVGYFLLHWLLAFNTYERYLLLIFMPVTLLAARGIEWLQERVRYSLPGARALIAFVLAFGLVFGGLAAATGATPVEDDRKRQTGIDELAAFLDSRSLGAIIYDPWLGWELGYYLGEWTDKRRVYYPSPSIMAEDALRQPDPAPRYFVAPAWQPHERWLNALHDAGFAVTTVYDDTRFVAYELLPPE